VSRKRTKAVEDRKRAKIPLHEFMTRGSCSEKPDLRPALLALLLLAGTIANLAVIIWTVLKWR
jgi:hypothetical protein